MMPPDPGQGTTPSTDLAGDPAGSVGNQSQSELYQDALNSAVTAEESAQHNLESLYAQGQSLGPQPNDTDAAGNPGPQLQAWLKQSQDLDRQIQSASTQLAQAKRNTATIYTKIASDSSTRARTQGQTAEWAAQAQSATAAANYKNDQAALLEAYGAGKDQATIQNLQAQAAKSQQQIQLIGQQVKTSASQQVLNSARAVQITETTPAVLQMDAARTQVYGTQALANIARTAYYNAHAAELGTQGDLNEARAALISGPQAQSLLSKSELDQARANKLDLTNGATLADLQAKAGLSDARIKQIYANIGKSQVLPYTDRTSPNLTIFQPSTGNVTGVPNPGYVNQTLQGITDTNQAIDAISQQIASGQMDPSTGNQLIDNMRQALQYKALGVTPDQYIQAQNQQAQLGMNVLGKYQETLGQGQTAANQFMSLASKVRGAVPQVSPFSTFAQVANNLYGPDIQKAQQLIQQVTPVTDKFSALKNIAILSQAKQALTGGQSSAPGQPTSPNQAPAPAGAPASDQPPPNPTVPQGLPANVPSNYPGGYQGAPYPPFESGGNP